MRLAPAREAADRLLAQHELTDWSFRFDRARTRCGSCHYGKRQISLSRYFVELNDPDEVENVLLHEIAHALAGPGVGHGPAWRTIAATIGARPEATASPAIPMPRARWALVCRNCLQVVARRHRRVLDLRFVRCRSCGTNTGELVWREGRS